MTTQRRSYETGHKPKCLVIVDDTAEWDRAVYYASRWAIRVGGGVVMLRIIEIEDQNQQWLGVADLMRAEAEDAAQEAFLLAYQSLGSFQHQSQFYTWLYRIAINTAKNALAARDRNPVMAQIELQDSDDGPDLVNRLKDPDTPEGLALTEEIRGTVNAAIDALPEDLRTAIVLRELEGLSYEEIAAAMDCPVGTVRSRIFRAREAIDRRLREVFEGGLGRAEELV